MAWGWLQSFAAQNSVQGSAVVATPGSDLTSGSTMIAIVSLSAGSTATCTGVANPTPTAFTKIVTSGYHNGTETSMWALNTPSVDAGTKHAVTATISQINSIRDIVVVEFSGIATGTTVAALVDGTPKSTYGSSNTATGSSSYTSTAASELLVMGYGDDGGPLTWALTANGGTNDNNGGTAKGFNANSSTDCELAFKNSTNGAETDSWALSGTATGWGIVCAAFKLATVAYTPVYTQEMVTAQAVGRASLW